LPKGQADAALNATSQQVDSPAFRLDFRDDLSGPGNHGAQHKRRRFLARDLSIINRWVNHEIDIVLRVRSEKNPHVWDFIFHRVHNEGLNKVDRSRESSTADLACGSGVGHKRDQRMFAQVAHVMEGVEKAIPAALVWLEFPKQRLDFQQAVLGSSLDSVFKMFWLLAERENAVKQIGVPGFEESASPSGMIDTCPSVLNDLGGQDAPSEWKRLSQAEFVDFVNAIRVRLSDSSVWLFTGKTINLGFQVVEMFICPCNTELGL
jgi:hypothetical protein